MKKYFTLVLMLLLSLGSVFSQDSAATVNDSLPLYAKRKNIVKISLTSLAFRNYQFSYERILNKTFSAALYYSTIPEGNVPFKTRISSLAEDEDLDDILDDTFVQYNSFTAEIRIYTGGHGKGFYFAPFYRNANYKVSGFPYEYTADDGSFQELGAAGEIKTNTFGLLLGTQFKLGNRIVLDWWILGPHYGTSSGNILATTTQALSQSEQDSVRSELEDIFGDIDLIETEVEVDANSANLKIDGPWAGIRAGFSLGFRF